MNALDAFDDNPDDALRSWVDELIIGDCLTRHHPRNVVGVIQDIMVSPIPDETHFHVMFALGGASVQISAGALRANYRKSS